MAMEVWANLASATVTSGGTTAPSAGTVQTLTLSGSTFPAISSTATPATIAYAGDPAAPSEVFLITNVSGSTATVTRGADGTTPVTHAAGFTLDQVLSRASLKALQGAGFGKALVQANNYCAGDGVTDDTAGMQAAINAVFAGAGLGLGGVYCPDQYLISSSLVCTSATGSAPGNGVAFVGADRQASQIVKGFNGALLTWNGNGGPNGNPSAFGGLRDITLNGNGFTGPLMQTNSANRMFFLNTAFDGNPDLTMDLNTMEDSYWVGCTSNNCGSTTAPVIKIYGSSTGTSNMLWFTQLRIESFLDGAVWIQQGTGNTGGNNGIFFSQCKFETTTVNGDFFVADGYTQQLLIDQCFFALDAFNGGYSTAVNCVDFGGSTAVGSNQFTLSNCWVHAASGTLKSVANINGASGAMTGPVTLSSIESDQTAATSVFIVNGCANVYLNVSGIDVAGNLFSGDGSYYSSSGNNYLEIMGSSFGFLNFNDLGFVPAMPLFNRLGSGFTVSGATTGTGAVVFGAQSAAEAGNGIGNSAFIVTDNDKVYTLKNELDDGSGNMTVAGAVAGLTTVMGSAVTGATGTTSQNVTGLVSPTLAARSYSLKIDLTYIPTGTIASTTTFGFSAGSGLTLSVLNLTSYIQSGSTTAELATSANVTSTTLSDAMWTSPVHAASTGFCRVSIWGTVTVSAGGTLQVVFANTTSADTVNIVAGASMTLMPI